METTAAVSPDPAARIGALLAEGGTPGAAVALRRDGRLALATGFGFRDREASAPIDADTVCGVASVTKMFTALAVLLLAEDGLLRVDDPVRAYLPEFRLSGGANTDAVRISHLLSHTSGLPPLPARHYATAASPELEAWERRRTQRFIAMAPPWDASIAALADLLPFLERFPYTVHGAPGERFSYSNEGYSLLGLIVERASGLPYARFVAERILRPCGMTRSSLVLGDVLAMENVTAVYTKHHGETARVRAWFHAPAMIPGGQLRSTANDIARFVEMLRNGGRAEGGRVATAATVAAMIAPRVQLDASRWYGYGTITKVDGHGITSIGHSGGHKGVSSHAAFVPQHGIACAVLTNVDGGPAAAVWDAVVYDALGLGAPPAPERPSLPEVTDATLASFLGEYGSAESGNVVVRVAADGALTVEADGQTQPARVVAADTLVFGAGDGERVVRFVPAPDGSAPFAYAFHGLRHLPRLA